MEPNWQHLTISKQNVGTIISMNCKVGVAARDPKPQKGMEIHKELGISGAR
jgi:hypothetical protein